MNNSFVVQATNLSKSFGKTEILHDIDLTMEKGEVCGLIGQNGAGKTTLLRILCGLMKTTRGTLALNTEKKFIGYMPQSCRFSDRNTVSGTIGMFTKLKGGNLNESLKLGEKLQLDLHKKVKYLSPGQQKKLQMILAMIGNPDFYILDEPTAGLDPFATFEMKSMIKELRIKGKTILISSHILEDMDELCTNVAIMEKGRLAYMNTLEDCYVFKTSPIQKEVQLSLRRSYALTLNPTGTILTVEIKREQVPELVKQLNQLQVGIYEITPSTMKNLVQQELHIGKERAVI